MEDTMEWLSDTVDQHWREIKLANQIVLAGATFVLLKRSKFGRQIKQPAVQLQAQDFAARKKLVARVVSASCEGNKAILNVYHEPPISWWLGLRFWPMVNKQATFPVHVFGVRPEQNSGLLVQANDQVRLQLLSRGSTDAVPNEVTAHVQYKMNSDLALDLIKQKMAKVEENAAPGRDASQDVNDIRDMDAVLTKLCKAQAKAEGATSSSSSFFSI
mmetsp:Transcript_4034/g.8663  ORF Transcript_4034/g.8663 Transcript_4034/m.8663 type:complete len:216 (-) Transcript_4034:1144-1791(-)